MSSPIIRVSVMRVEPAQFAHFAQLLAESESALVPGIKGMKGCQLYFAGADEATTSVTNVSIWDSLEDAQQMSRFQPKLDLAKPFFELGAQFERPIRNYATLWRLENPLPSRRAGGAVV